MIFFFFFSDLEEVPEPLGNEGIPAPPEHNYAMASCFEDPITHGSESDNNEENFHDLESPLAEEEM